MAATRMGVNGSYSMVSSILLSEKPVTVIPSMREMVSITSSVVVSDTISMVALPSSH